MAKSDKVSKEWLAGKRKVTKDGPLARVPAKKTAPARKATLPPPDSPLGRAMKKTTSSKLDSRSSAKAKSPAQRKAGSIADRAMDYASKHGNRTVAAEDQGMRVRAAVSNAKTTAGKRAYIAANDAMTSDGMAAKVFRGAAKAGKVARVAGKVAGPVGAAMTAYDAADRATNPTRLKNAAKSMAKVHAVANSGGKKGTFAYGEIASKEAAKKKAAKPAPAKKTTRKYAKSTPQNDVTKRPGWQGGRGTI